MSRYQKLSQEILSVLQSTDQTRTPKLEQQAAEYSELVAKVNDRLERCGELLRNGLRTEAIHLAESEPPVLELVSDLDLGGDEELWAELCADYDLPVPQSLLIGRAEELEEAYAQQAPLEDLLSRWRRVNLSRAPMDVRVPILRQLVEADPHTHFWEVDLHSFEQVAIKDAQQEAAQAVKQGNIGRVRDLLAYLRDDSWSVPVPNALIQKLTKAGASLQSNQARQTLTELAPQLDQALSENDLDWAMQLTDQWAAVAKKVNLANDDPLIEQVQPALGWVSDERARKKESRRLSGLVYELEELLNDQSNDTATLERLIEATNVDAAEIPDSLQRRARNRLAELRIRERRRWQVTVGVSVFAVLAVVGLVGFVGYQSLRSQAMNKQSEAIRGLLADGDLESAEQRYQDLTEEYEFEQLEWLGLGDEIRQAKQTDVERKAALQQLIQMMTDQLDSKQFESISESHWKRAGELAASSDEQLLVERLRRRQQAGLSELAEQRAEQFQVQSDSLITAFKEAELAIESHDWQKASDQLSAASDQIASIRSNASQLARAQLQMLPPWENRLEETKKLIQSGRTREDLLNTLTAHFQESASDPTSWLRTYRKRMDTYIVALPDDYRTADFKLTIEEIPLWDDYFQWQQAKQDWIDNPYPSDLQVVAARREELASFAMGLETKPYQETLQRYDQQLATIETVFGEDGSVQSVRDFLSMDVLQDDLHVLRQGETRYYTWKSQRDGNSVKVLEQKGSKSLLISSGEPAVFTPATHVPICRKILKDFETLAPDNWVGKTKTAAVHVLANDTMLPEIQWLLVTMILEMAAEGDEQLAKQLAPIRSKLTKKQVPLDLPWWAPQERVVVQWRPVIVDLLKSVTPMDLLNAWANVEEKAETPDWMSRKMRPVAWMYRRSATQGSSWSLKGLEGLKRQTSLWVLVPASDDGQPGRWKTIGYAGPSGAGLQFNAPAVQEGRLVFAGQPE
ncbi:coiled-coil domain-containing protein [Thalassoroseus pseudoceratinae]|uniref:hypothetical protein n=1 Tax=Thalassoroseus pseudoceratinae TaxID=2713176 RepID=UPI00141FB637|nr:hypothetical protein [Thalassoroseus pseudoceratinae]